VISSTLDGKVGGPGGTRADTVPDRGHETRATRRLEGTGGRHRARTLYGGTV
jgi:hypothetical protein